MGIEHPHDALPPGYRLGCYEILRVLGRGGFGITYQARRVGSSGKMVAIKELFPGGLIQRGHDHEIVLLPGAPEDQLDDIRSMFLKESEIICQIDHPNVVSGIETMRQNNTGYLVMRYISGKNLRDSLHDKAGFRPCPDTLPPLLYSLLEALKALHSTNILHCDIKPENIYLGIGYEPMLIDLGSARMHNGVDFSTEAYTYSHYFSAIEQVSEDFGEVGPWTDIYQISAVIYRCITGGKLPDAMDRIKAPEDPYYPLQEMKEVSDYPKKMLSALDHGLEVYPGSRPESISSWKREFGYSFDTAQKQNSKNHNKLDRPKLSSRKHASSVDNSLNSIAQPSDPLAVIALILLVVIIGVIILLVFR